MNVECTERGAVGSLKKFSVKYFPSFSYRVVACECFEAANKIESSSSFVPFLCWHLRKNIVCGIHCWKDLNIHEKGRKAAAHTRHRKMLIPRMKIFFLFKKKMFHAEKLSDMRTFPSSSLLPLESWWKYSNFLQFPFPLFFFSFRPVNFMWILNFKKRNQLSHKANFNNMSIDRASQRRWRRKAKIYFPSLQFAIHEQHPIQSHKHTIDERQKFALKKLFSKEKKL